MGKAGHARGTRIKRNGKSQSTKRIKDKVLSPSDFHPSPPSASSSENQPLYLSAFASACRNMGRLGWQIKGGTGSVGLGWITGSGRRVIEENGVVQRSRAGSAARS